MATTQDHSEATRTNGGLIALYCRFDNLIGRIAEPVILVALRIYIFSVFFPSGVQKLERFGPTVEMFGNDEWGFGPVSFLPPEIMAVLATAFELICPVLILAGLLTRLATLPLLAMALMIQFILAAAILDFHNIEHFVWMAALGILLRFGPGALSIEGLLHRKA